MEPITLAEVGAGHREALARRDEAILKARQGGMPLAQIALLSGVSIGAIRNIIKRDSERNKS